MINYKISKINSLIKETISAIIAKELAEEIQFVSINFVNTTKDLSETFAYVHFAQGDQEKQFDVLNKKRYIIQKKFASGINLRRTPKIIFILDTEQDKINNIEKLLNKVSKQ